jgi:hypothetical protein
MDVMSVFNLLEDEADDELLLLAYLFREESDEMYSERNREGCYNNLIHRRLIDNETKFIAYFRVSFELFNYILNYISVMYLPFFPMVIDIYFPAFSLILLSL